MRAGGEFGRRSRFRPTISATQANIVRVPPRKPSLALGVVSLAPGRPRKMGQEKGDSKNVLPVNSVTLVGFVGADPEQRQARNNSSNSPFFPSLHSARGRTPRMSGLLKQSGTG